MDTVRQQFANVTPDDDAELPGEKLTARQERFAELWAELGNQSAAYRGAYNVGEKTPPHVIWVRGSETAAIPKIRARYEQLKEKALEKTIVTIREALQWQYDIATADPADLVRTVVRCCRHCHGINYKYQWRDDDEYISACVLALDTKGMPPLDTGGYGFDGTLPPNSACPHCYGAGHEVTIIADTTKLVGKAKKLYAGAEQDRYGKIKIKMHDQQAAWEKVCRMIGAFDDKLDLRTPAQRAAEMERAKLPDNVTAEEAGKAYLSLLG